MFILPLYLFFRNLQNDLHSVLPNDIGIYNSQYSSLVSINIGGIYTDLAFILKIVIIFYKTISYTTDEGSPQWILKVILLRFIGNCLKLVYQNRQLKLHFRVFWGWLLLIFPSVRIQLSRIGSLSPWRFPQCPTSERLFMHLGLFEILLIVHPTFVIFRKWFIPFR